MSEFLVEAARNSPAIATNLKKLRQRAEAAIRDAAIADTVLDARDLRPGDDAHQTPEPSVPAFLEGSSVIDTDRSWSSRSPSSSCWHCAPPRPCAVVMRACARPPSL